MVDEELIESFRIESEEHLEAIESELLALEKIEDPVMEECNVQESLNSAFRAAHSLKGAAGFLGFMNITAVTHAMENILGELRNSLRCPGVECANLLFDSLDALTKLFEELNDSDKIDVDAIILRLNAYVEKVNNGALDKTYQKAKENSSVAYSNGMFKFIISAAHEDIINELSNIGNVLAHTKNNSKFDFILETALEKDLLLIALDGIDFDIADYQDEMSTDIFLKDRLEKAADESAKAPAKKLAKKEQSESIKKIVKPMESSVRVPVALLSELMALAGELVLVRNQHLRWATESGDAKAKEISSRLDTVTTELQTSIIRTRMQPLDKVLSRLPRIVRDISQALGKKIKLEIIGREVEVDKTILESIVDPLTHLLRNSCDHGIETPLERVSLNKDETGTIRVIAQQESGHITISIKDDGKGIDPERIGEIALGKGMVSESELAKMSNYDKISLIMLPGFSTAKSISNISGRGVGMDVVRSSIEKIGGSFEINSEVGEGTAFLLNLPLTLAIIQSLVISEAGKKYLIPRINLEEVISLIGKDVKTCVKAVNGQEVLNYHGSLLQLVRLSEVFDSKKVFDTKKREDITEKYRNFYNGCCINNDVIDSTVLDIAVVRVGQKRFGLIIDKALETEEIVVKPLHPAQGDIKIFMGSTIMGDGSVSLILDIDGIAKHALSEVRYLEKEQKADDTLIHSESMQKVLSFAAGSRDKFALALSFIRRIYTINASDIKDLGGKEFVLIGDKSINIARLGSVFGYKEKHNQGEVYLIMPRFGSYNCGIVASEIFGLLDAVIDFEGSMIKKEGILGTSLIGDDLTIFPDIYYICEKTLGAESKGLVFERGRLDRPKRVLVAEDTPFFRQLVKTYLSSDAMVVDTAVNGKEALDMLVRCDYDLLLSDIEMPVMNGLELIKEVRSRNEIKSIPAISLTSLNTEEDKQRCLDAGYDTYLAKLNREEFHDSIKKIFKLN